MFKFANLKSTVAAFVEDRGGNFAIMFAIAAVPVLMSVGIAVDYTRMLNAKSDMQNALDVALISTAKDIAQGKIKPSDAKAAVRTFFEVNLNANRYDTATTTITDFKFDPATIKVSASVQTDLPLVFPIFGSGNTRKVGTSAVASYIERKVEVSMVLDVTGSMGHDAAGNKDLTKINDLKIAAKAGVKEFIDNSSGNTRVAIVPYAFGVNAGGLKTYVVDENGQASTKDACATERRGNEMFTDASPVSAKITRADFINYASRDWSGPVELYCPNNAVLPLTKNANTLNAAINALTPEGGTAGHIGLQWGRYMLSPNWKTVLPSSSEPVDYNTPHAEKYLILMTDGMFNSDASGLDNASVPTYPGISALSGRLAMALCDSIKAQNVKIFTIGFRLKDIPDASDEKEATRLLSDCASTPSGAETTFFNAENGAQLTAAFKEIAKRVEVVALTN